MVGNDMTTIGEIAVVFDGPHATPKKTDSGPYFLSISSLENGKLDLSKSAHLSEEQFIKWTERVTPEEGDILFSYETRLGEAALMPPNVKGCLGRRMGLLRPDQNKVLPAYLLYAYLSHDFQSTIEQRKNHGCTVDRIALKELPSFPIRIPPLPEQKSAVHILKSLDNKIELNRQMNATLEGMAQGLFKSWFVDFDPVIDNALAAGNPIPEAFAARAETRRKALAYGAANRDVAKQFPAAFEFTEEMGWIPEGWEVKTSSSLFDVKDGTHDSPKQSITGKYLITSRHIIGNTIDYSNAYLISEEDFNEVNKRSKVDSYDILLTMIGTVGCPFIVMEEEINFAIKNVGLFKTGINRTLATYFFIYLKSHFMKSFMESRLAGTTQKYLTLKILRALPVIVPHSDIMEKFGEQTNSIFNKIHFNNNTTNYLISIRDTLLPKLISGEIRIPEAEKITEKALA